MAVSEEKANQLAEVVKAIAHPMRLRIISFLCENDWRVLAMAEALGKSQSAVSQQLRILRMSGLVAAQNNGGQQVYTLAEPRLRNLVDCLEDCRP